MGYSVDLRERIVEAVQERNFSIHEAAATFRVATQQSRGTYVGIENGAS